MAAPDIVKKLVEGFEEHRDAYRSGRYNETTDRQINALVYELYGLTEEEIKIVEGD